MSLRTLTLAGAVCACLVPAPHSDAEAVHRDAAPGSAAAAPVAPAPADPGHAAPLHAAADSARGEDRSGNPADDFGPTSEPPWNPERPLSGDAPWETAVRAPGRLASLPLSLAGAIGRRTLLAVEEHSLVPRAVFLVQVMPRVGVVATPASLGDRTGLGGALRLDPPPLRPWVRAEISASTRHYNRVRLEASAGPLAAEYGYEWRPSELFYGIGLDAREADGAVYAAQSEHARIGLEWPARGRDGRPARARIAGWLGPRELVVRAGRVRHEGDRDAEAPDEDDRALAEVFPALAAAIEDVRVEHLVYGVRGVLDLRRGAPHWTHGVRVAGAIERFDRPLEALALHGARPLGRAFTRATLEAETGVSFWRDPRTVRLAVRVVDQEPSAGAGAFLLPDLARLGGGEGLWGYEPRRWQDLDALVARLTYVFPLAQHFEFDLHAEAGGVYADVWEAPRLAGLRTSVGAAFRPRTRFAPIGFIGVDVSREAVRIRYAFGGVE